MEPSESLAATRPPEDRRRRPIALRRLRHLAVTKVTASSPGRPTPHHPTTRPAFEGCRRVSVITTRRARLARRSHVGRPDPGLGAISTARRLPPLLRCQARYAGDPVCAEPGDAPEVVITFPDGEEAPKLRPACARATL